MLVFQGSGLGAAPEATQDRLHAIQEKLEERQRILALPQRFAGSKQLSRREMEIENALFQGTDRHSFLRALYHEGLWAQGSSCLGSSTESQAVWEPDTFLSGLLSLKIWFYFGAVWEEIFSSLTGAEGWFSEGFNVEAFKVRFWRAWISLMCCM